MGLYERIGGGDFISDKSHKIAVHRFVGVMQEFSIGTMSGTEATNAFSPPLSAGEQAEAAALRDQILLESNANNNALRKLKAVEVERVLFLLEERVAPLHTVAAVKARLNVT